jgi:metal-responsive CopG/Arc/MetJ family transcriptional regulator
MPPEPVIRKKRGRPVTGKAIPVATVRLPPELLLALDVLASEQKPTASRSDVIRRILTEHLKANGYL